MANEERINKIIDELTLFDDDLMSRVFDKNTSCASLRRRRRLSQPSPKASARSPSLKA